MKVRAWILFVAVVFFTGCGGGGGNETTDAGPQTAQDDSGSASPAKNNIAFVTSAFGKGNFSLWADAGGKTGLTAADAICNARAKAAGLDGTFVAWVSDDTSDAYCRVVGLTGKKDANCGQPSLPTNAGPWVRTDGKPFADTIDKIVGQQDSYYESMPYLYFPVRFDEFGKDASLADAEDVSMFTNTTTAGKNYSHHLPCNNWTDIASTEKVLVGYSGRIGNWTDNWGASCSTEAHLLCFQLGQGSPLPNASQTGKISFVSSARGNGNFDTWAESNGKSGIDGADAICGNLATAAGLAGNFKAFISDSSHGRLDRLTTDGPWVRLDGLPIANPKSFEYLAPLNMTETKQYTYASVWLGSSTDDYYTMSCADWTSNNEDDQGNTGSSDSDRFFDVNSWNYCNADKAIYCFED